MDLQVRDATAADARACAAVYAPYVLGTAVTFETSPPDEVAVAARIAAAQERYAWLVLVAETGDAGEVVGYAYGGPFAARPAYRWSAEVSVYLRQGLHRSGGGRLLYGELLPRLAQRGYRNALAGMTLPNDASIGLHTALGFEAVGTYARIGHKLGAWYDVLWMQKPLGGRDGEPAEPC